MTSTSAPRFGAKIPQIELTGSADDIRTYATTIRDLGYVHLTSEDHVLGGTPDYRGTPRAVFSSEYPVQEVFSLFSYVAGIAPELEVASGVLILPQRQTALVAKQSAAIENLTGGKLRLGVGIGWNDLEYTTLGQAWANRAARFEEQIELLRAFWSDPVIDFQGKFHIVENAGINPRPVSGRIPLWIGAAAEPAVRRAARLGDGFIPLGRLGGEAERQLAVFRDELRNVGRDPADVGLEGWINLTPGADEVWKHEAERWRSEGATHITLVTERLGYRSLPDHLAALAKARDIIGS
ncbi:MAG: TIGR03619 family F420-dependent LLM class oxidoreductase [Chloroflexia bacterium]|nr:TIGR03619 family F420-dependent LLM class oxidoreductase [Chloroflexia bacterium]